MLAAQCGNLKSIYRVDLENPNISSVKGIRRIATLHEEKVHVIIRTKTLEGIADNLDKVDSNSETEAIIRLDELREALKKNQKRDRGLCWPGEQRYSGNCEVRYQVSRSRRLHESVTPSCVRYGEAPTYGNT